MHYLFIKNGEIEKANVAAHVWKEKHAVNCKPFLLKQASNKQELTKWESSLVTENKNHIINVEIPPVDHLTKKFIINTVENSRSAPTRSSSQSQ